MAAYNVRLKTRALASLPVDEDADEVTSIIFILYVVIHASENIGHQLLHAWYNQST